MSFFDSKQEVISFEITPYGKKKLMEGKFKPEYYAFKDDDILYDGQYAGLTEKQNDIDPRILENVPRLKTQTKFQESTIKKISSEPRDLLPFDSQFKNSNLLGTSQNKNRNLPYWNISVLKGEISGSVTQLTSSLYPNISTPVIDLGIIRYKPEVRTAPNTVTQAPELTNIAEERISVASSLFEDNTYIFIPREYIILKIEEENTELLVDNFEIELFEIENGQEKRLLFKEETSVVDEQGLLREIPEFNNTQITDKVADFFFDVEVDSEIDINTLSKNIPFNNQGFEISDPIIDFRITESRRLPFNNEFDQFKDEEDC